MDEGKVKIDELNNEIQANGDGVAQDNEMQDSDSLKEAYRKQLEQGPKKKKRKRRKQHFFLKVAIVLGLLIAIFAFLSSSFFAVTEIESLSNKHFTSKQIIKMSGIKKGENIFMIRKKVVKNELVKSPYINSVEIKKVYPRKIQIIAQERRPFATLKYGSKYALIDKEGYVLDIRKVRPKITLIENVSVKSLKEDEIIEVKEKEIMKASIEMINLMKKENLFFKKIDLKNKKEVRLYVYDMLVFTGNSEELTKNIENGNVGVIVYDLYKKKIKRGTVDIGDTGYCSFTPIFE
ncbi:MAG: FtsQ-type POTRA domain-containing protein [Anaerovoracaceae bacterium]